MYTTCLNCQHDLGRNESLELFPVGRRLAFDQMRGRLWVVCLHCARWNFSPLDEQWGGRITESVAALLAFQGRSVVLAEEPHLSLALEMSVYEDQERRWLESELWLLEQAWKDAEEVAAIADSLTLPKWLEARMERMKGKDLPSIE